MRLLTRLVLPLIALCVAARADVFLLADGSRIEGVGTEDGEQLAIATFDGKEIKVARKNIKGTISEPRRNEYFSKLKQLKESDAEGHFQLGLFAQQNNLKKEAEAQFQAALKIDPAHEGAGAALGYELTEGKYQPPQDTNVRIGSRPSTPKPIEPAREEIQAMLKRLGKAPLDKLPATANAEIDALIQDTRERPEVLAKILISPRFGTAVSSATPELRARAAKLAGLTQDRRVMQALIDSCIYDPEEPVRLAAAKALALLEEPVAMRKLMDIAISGDRVHFPWLIRKLAAQALRRYGNKEIIDRMMKELSFELAGGSPFDPKNKLRGRGAGLGTENPLAIPENPPDSGMSFEDMYPVLSALKEITGASFDKGEKDFKTWLNWWKKEGGTFAFKD